MPAIGKYNCPVCEPIAFDDQQRGRRDRSARLGVELKVIGMWWICPASSVRTFRTKTSPLRLMSWFGGHDGRNRVGSFEKEKQLPSRFSRTSDPLHPALTQAEPAQQFLLVCRHSRPIQREQKANPSVVSPALLVNAPLSQLPSTTPRFQHHHYYHP